MLGTVTDGSGTVRDEANSLLFLVACTKLESLASINRVPAISDQRANSQFALRDGYA
jgi:hypothetical protein